MSFSECYSIIFKIETMEIKTMETMEIIETDEIKCCRENGVPDYCFGYCLIERKKSESRAVTGVCKRWLEQIGHCTKGLLI